MVWRDIADYGGVSRVTPADAQAAVANARRIVDFVRQACPELTAP